MRTLLIATVAAGVLFAPLGGHAARQGDLAPAPMTTAGMPTTPLTATSAAATPAASNPITALVVEAGSGRVLTLPMPVSNVFVSDPKIVEVRPASPTSLFLFGVTPGRSTVAALDTNGQPVRQFQVTVKPSTFTATETAGGVARTTQAANVIVEATPRRLILSGRVNSPADANAATTVASGYIADGQAIDNRMRVNGQIQVSLRVRIAEMSRDVTRALGINWTSLGNIGKLAVNFATSNALTLAAGSGATGASVLNSTYNSGHGGAINNLIDALAQDNLVRLLAEPNLTAMSGEVASFLVGGEFPIPVAQQNNSVSVEFKPYGIALAFVPTVLGEDRIRLHVRPEVSQLTTQGAVQLSSANTSISIPALTVRRADTTIELGSGQSFAMAGLLSDNSTQTVNALPGLGELPVLGPLFRSDSFQRHETELVIIVTPYIVRPVNDQTALRLPTDVERLLMLRQVGRATPDMAQRVPGQAGFVVE